LLAKHCQSVPLNFSKCRAFCSSTETHGDTTVKKPLTFQNLLSDIPVSEATLRRLISDGRKGIGNFPLPITGSKRKLLFNPDDIERWMNSHRQSPPDAKVEESATQRSKRHAAAMKRLESKGVRVANSKPLDGKET
jgi:predicted DNA-binding transcriptional regulator AlpA